MPKNKPAVSAPAIERIVFPELTAGSPDQLAPSAGIDAAEFAGVNLPTLDLDAARVETTRFTRVAAREARLRNITLTESVLTGIDVPVVRGARGHWRDVQVTESRLGSAELYESTWERVHFVGCRLTFVNLRGAKLRDVLFTDCTIEELDLGGAEALRVSFERTRIQRLDVSRARLTHVDLRGADFDETSDVDALRGAVIDSSQLLRLAPLLAARVGLIVED